MKRRMRRSRRKESLFSHPTPFTPNPTDEDELSVLRLIRSRRVGPSTFQKLLTQYGSVAAALEALPQVARAAGAEEYVVCSRAAAQEERATGQRFGARLIIWGAPDYPPLLREIPDPPAVLWAKGDMALLSRLCVAVVGARAASGLAVRMTRKLAQELGEAGLVTVSGLAKGVDAAAHAGALETGTIAVQPGGLDVLYPCDTAKLADQIAERGLRLSEQPFGAPPRAQSFLARNRIIAGLSRGLVVVEASARSGALNAARHASEQGREVMAVPGHPFEPRASGCNLLIRDGATLIRSTRDILEGLVGAGVELPEVHRPAEKPGAESAPSGEDRIAADGSAYKGVADAAPNPAKIGAREPTARSSSPRAAAAPSHSAVAAPVLPTGGVEAPLQHAEIDEMTLVDWLLAQLAIGPMQEENLLLSCSAPTAQALQAISVLELEGAIRRGAGGTLELG